MQASLGRRAGPSTEQDRVGTGGHGEAVAVGGPHGDQHAFGSTAASVRGERRGRRGSQRRRHRRGWRRLGRRRPRGGRRPRGRRRTGRERRRSRRRESRVLGERHTVAGRVRGIAAPTCADGEYRQRSNRYSAPSHRRSPVAPTRLWTQGLAEVCLSHHAGASDQQNTSRAACRRCCERDYAERHWSAPTNAPLPRYATLWAEWS